MESNFIEIVTPPKKQQQQKKCVNVSKLLKKNY